MTIRIVQAGMGGWGRNWAKNIVAQNQDVELVACVDPDEQMLALAQKELGVSPEICFPTLETAFDAVECDGVLITAFLSAHVPLALTALKAGKHVLLEKPFAPTLQEAQEVVETAERCQRHLLISQNYRFYPAVQTVMELLREGTFGPVGSVTLDFRRYGNEAPFEKKRHYSIWQPLLVDMSIHHFDLMRVVLDQEPCRIECQTWNPPGSKFIEPPAAAATITFDGGTVVSYRGSWVSAGPATSWAGEWRMECERGAIDWTSRHETRPDRVTLRPLGRRVRHLKLPDMPLFDRHGSLNAFVQTIRTGKVLEPACTGRNNLKTLAFMFAMVEAASSGATWVAGRGLLPTA